MRAERSSPASGAEPVLINASAGCAVEGEGAWASANSTYTSSAMYNNFTQLYLHLVWATWNRVPLITPQVESSLYNAIAARCCELQCQPLAIGGMPDHVHLLTGFPATISVAVIAKQVKGSTSHLMTHVVTPETEFKWQGSYGAFTVSKSGVERVVSYIRGQKTHHAAQQLIDDFECCTGDAAIWDGL